MPCESTAKPTALLGTERLNGCTCSKRGGGKKQPDYDQMDII